MREQISLLEVRPDQAYGMLRYRSLTNSATRPERGLTRLV
jgi:hypothetical protein